MISINIPEKYIYELEELVRQEFYLSRSEAIRAAVRDLLKRELWMAGQAIFTPATTPITTEEATAEKQLIDEKVVLKT
ncbi:MAG: ribbon-helix-helix domain-containing protein [Candidatus Hodarchaeota archaeon]